MRQTVTKLKLIFNINESPLNIIQTYVSFNIIVLYTWGKYSKKKKKYIGIFHFFVILPFKIISKLDNRFCLFFTKRFQFCIRNGCILAYLESYCTFDLIQKFAIQSA